MASLYDQAPPNERGITSDELSRRFGPRQSYLHAPVQYDKWLSESLAGLDEDSMRAAHRLVYALMNPFQGSAEGLRFPGCRDAQLLHTTVSFVSKLPRRRLLPFLRWYQPPHCV
uniref:Uncharacterized protein n=1 Tax=viral metagenome TaxID=1070528 RepID=A0A2V0RHX8_9ZZZZ